MATFPITVTSDAGFTLPSSPQYGGPYANDAGTALYLFALDTGAGELVVFKSSTGQSWSQVAGQTKALDVSFVTTPQTNSGFTTCRGESNKVHAVFTAPGPVLGFASYDMATDTWSITTSGPGPVAGVVLFPNCCVLRDDGVLMVIAGAGATNSNTGAWVPVSMCAGAESRLHAFFYLMSAAGNSVPSYVGFTIGTLTWGTFATFDTEPQGAINDGYHQPILADDTLGAVEQIAEMSTLFVEDLIVLVVSTIYDVANDVILLAMTNFGNPVDVENIAVGSAPEGESLTFSFDTIEGASGGAILLSDIGFVINSGSVFLFAIRQGASGGEDFLLYTDTGSGFGPEEIIGSLSDVAPFNSGSLNVAPISTSWSLAFAGSIYYFGVLLAPTSVVIGKPRGGGGIFFPRSINRTFILASLYRALAPSNTILSPQQTVPLSSFFLGPNEYDLCLMRDLELFNLIDREQKSCARKPECFLVDERAWTDAPAGFVTFNPTKAIPLPDPADENVVILSFRVPFGYDGMILGQFHGYTGSTFEEGSGDIVWRIRANGRYMRDVGNMLVTIGSQITVAPIAGGLQVRSGNLVEYVVSAPNGSSSLPLPGQQNILASLHGYFYPRGKS